MASPKSIAIMVFILDGCSFYYAHVWSKSGISIWRRHLVTSKEWSNPIFFLRKYLFLHQACATCSEQPSYIKTMIDIGEAGCQKLNILYTLPFNLRCTQRPNHTTKVPIVKYNQWEQYILIGNEQKHSDYFYQDVFVTEVPALIW